MCDRLVHIHWWPSFLGCLKACSIFWESEKWVDEGVLRIPPADPIEGLKWKLLRWRGRNCFAFSVEISFSLVSWTRSMEGFSETSYVSMSSHFCCWPRPRIFCEQKTWVIIFIWLHHGSPNSSQTSRARVGIAKCIWCALRVRGIEDLLVGHLWELSKRGMMARWWWCQKTWWAELMK
jgi:hypothetical protein